MTTPPDELTAGVARLVVSRDGAEYTIGRPDLGVYVAVPEAGAVFIETLQGGGSVEEAAERAGELAGQPVDGADFLEVLSAAELLDAAAGPDISRTDTGDRRAIRWIEGVSPRVARLFFGRVAWSLYVAAAAFCTLTLVLVDAVRPSYEDWWFLGDPVLSLVVMLPIILLLAAVHEAWHWLAGRAVGVPAVFRVSRRGPFLVFETDLTQIVSLPRRARYGPFLAGAAFDLVVLAAALALRLLEQQGVLALAPMLYRLLGAVVLLQLTGLLFQAAVFLRSDGYAVLANALRCHNLYRASWLTLKSRLLRPNESDLAELAAVGEHDRRVASWFSAAYLVGMLAVAWFALTFMLPYLISMTGWLATSLGSAAITTALFWESAAVLLFLVGSVAGPPLLALRERRLRRRGVLL